MTDTHNVQHAEFAALTAEMLEGHDGLRFRARGQSMSPSICDGDVLVLEKVGGEDLGVGDVVLVRTELDTLLAHRIIRRDVNRLTTCGDAVSVPDPVCDVAQVIGKVVTVERNGRTTDLRSRDSQRKGRMWAAASRHGRSLFGRALKRLLRLLSPTTRLQRS